MPPFHTDAKEPKPSRGGLTALGWLALSLVVLYLPNESQQEMASLLRGSLLRPFVMTQETLARARVHAADTEILQAQVDSLSSVISSQNTLVEENDGLRDLLQLSRRLPSKFVAASVIRPGTPGSESMFLLDAGVRRGVHANTPVVVGRGLLGVVREARATSSVGMDWTHPQFRASAMTLDGAVYGMVQASQGRFREDTRLLVDGIPFHQELSLGTILVTSGLGGLYPRGIPIGAVEEEAEARAGWRRSYWLRPFVEPGQATHVLVLVSGGEGLDQSGLWAAEDSVPLMMLDGEAGGAQDLPENPTDGPGG